jgi:hypothetical protein
MQAWIEVVMAQSSRGGVERVESQCLVAGQYRRGYEGRVIGRGVVHGAFARNRIGLFRNLCPTSRVFECSDKRERGR